MASFDLGGLLLSKQPSSPDYGFLIDRVKMKKDRLSEDGKLAPGDYDSVISEYQKLYSHPGFSKSQRSDIEVLISGLQREKQLSIIKDSQDIPRLNREVEGEYKNAVYKYGNDPLIVLKAKSASLENKMFLLDENIYDLQRSGDDPTPALLERDKAKNEWLDSQAAISLSENRKPGTPIEGFIANIETNSNGEIRDIHITKGTEPGFILTTGILGGFTVAGKVDPKVSAREGKNVFKIGDTIFSAPSILRPGPAGELRPEILTAESQQTPFGSHGKTKSTGDFVELDSASIRPQKSTLSGDWIQSTDGSLYKDIGNRQFERYVGATPEKLGITDSDIWKNLPEAALNSIKARTVKTNDLSQQISLPQDAIYGPPSPQVGTTPQASQVSPQPAGRERTPSPVATSPRGGLGYAQQTISKAGSFLKSLFGR
jgi:hypothetical protein